MEWHQLQNTRIEFISQIISNLIELVMQCFKQYLINSLLSTPHTKNNENNQMIIIKLTSYKILRYRL